MPEQGLGLSQLQATDEFIRRHVGPREHEVGDMLATLGIDSLDALIRRAVPAVIQTTDFAMDPPATETQVLERLREMMAENELFTSLIGMGYYGTVVPPVIQRNLLENPGWYTAYTPYQAEISQGRLEALLNYQQMITDLTGMDIANASLLDEATAAAEAMAMARRVSKSKSNRFFVHRDCHPQTLAVVSTRADPINVEVVVGGPKQAEEGEYFGAVLCYPASSGEIHDWRSLIQVLHERKAVVAMATDLLSLCLLESPGMMGADMVFGSAQRFGVPMGYGGPHAAFFATLDRYKRAIPGRIIGVSVDSTGKPALRMALQTREQHIRREKATSNICTAQVLLAVMAGMYGVYHGADGLRRIASRVHLCTRIVADGLAELGLRRVNQSFFDTLTLAAPGRAAALVEQVRAAGINLRLVDPDHFALSLDETTGPETMDTLLGALGAKAPRYDDAHLRTPSGIPEALGRRSLFLTHPVFGLYQSETEMLRYLRRLAAKDIALDRAMIPLGSCTMKLNATAQMMPVTWPEIGNLHPFVPLSQARGYQRLFAELEGMLCDITGFDAVSLQPNAGSQGEYAGLLLIRAYHASRGEDHRDVCLIPSSAHGTNPASAQMAGMRVVVVDCDHNGNVDTDDLRAKAAQHGSKLAALMITYPSTHGVFEEAIKEICHIIHEHGAQVYMDGANLNAMVGVCKPAQFGADVSHMNLHKTFCIPHGGGGPGMGPIGAKAHLAEFFPDHPVVPVTHCGTNSGTKPQRSTLGTVSAAPWGSASILPISWAYIALMGGEGLRRATEVAILNANYMARRLEPHFPVLYTGADGMVAHECIIDLREIKERTGVTVDDVAKRLVDYGFHAPTMSWPVHDTMMVEPTESEGKAELDRFCDAMIAIRGEIAEVEAGDADRENNLLKHAPHTQDLLVADKWDRPYSKERAFFPLASSGQDKYWPPVGRVDNVHGDRNLVCACPPLTAYSDAAD